MAGFIDTMRAEGYAVESICRVLREQGCQVAVRTYRSWRRQDPAARTITDAQVIDAVGPLRDPHPRAAPRIGAASNLGRFTYAESVPQRRSAGADREKNIAIEALFARHDNKSEVL
jgi:hypothetical protein